jgi:hypothetical protein
LPSLSTLKPSEYKKETLEDAVKATAKAGKAPASTATVTLLVKDFDRYRTLQIDYHDGLRYPHLERFAGTPDRLSAIFAARK